MRVMFELNRLVLTRSSARPGKSSEGTDASRHVQIESDANAKAKAKALRPCRSRRVGVRATTLATG
jgi:hypothetical protein